MRWFGWFRSKPTPIVKIKDLSKYPDPQMEAASQAALAAERERWLHRQSPRPITSKVTTKKKKESDDSFGSAVLGAAVGYGLGRSSSSSSNSSSDSDSSSSWGSSSSDSGFSGGGGDSGGGGSSDSF